MDSTEAPLRESRFPVGSSAKMMSGRPAPVGAAWADQLRPVAHGIRRALLAHPALITAAVRRPPRQEATLRGIDAGLGLLLAAGLEPEAAAKGYQAVLFYTLGFAALEAPFAASPDGGVQDQADTHAVLAGLPADDYPHVAATLAHLYGPDLTAQFDHGLRLLLAGLSVQEGTAERAPGSGPRRRSASVARSAGHG